MISSVPKLTSDGRISKSTSLGAFYENITCDFQFT